MYCSGVICSKPGGGTSQYKDGLRRLVPGLRAPEPRKSTPGTSRPLRSRERERRLSRDRERDLWRRLSRSGKRFKKV